MQQPDVEFETNAEIVQDQTPNEITVPVRVEGIPVVQPLPGRGGGQVWSEVLTDGAAARLILNDDPRRRKAQLISSDYKFYVGASQQQATAGNGGPWPINVPLVWESTNELWALAAEAGHDSTLAVVAERWAE